MIRRFKQPNIGEALARRIVAEDAVFFRRPNRTVLQQTRSVHFKEQPARFSPPGYYCSLQRNMLGIQIVWLAEHRVHMAVQFIES